ncbi:MAG: VWA domain-containing protein [Weeksellaceae bacterium]|jgi:Ca-activated chloride channel family protein|nr:VWA domain-containing protein [Weeksellaceae bacterium]MDX9704158.1 VWA domain-containing protein [Weeksellaceae bacterium]
MGNYEFQNPWWLLLLLLIPVLIFFRIKKRKKQTAVRISTLKPFEYTDNFFNWIKPLLFTLRLLALGFIIIALARPQIVKTSTSVKSEKGIDIIMTVDTSLSMLARDLHPDRLEALKEVAKRFAMDRPADRIGLVDYSGEAVLKVPLTTDHHILIQEIDRLQTGELADGTAIGVGLATAVNHLKDSKANSKIIILLTDGVESIDYQNDLLYISPADAAQIAAARGIKVYTIGIGSTGMAPFPTGRNLFTGEIIFSMKYNELDEPMMQNVADLTGGKYFRATDNESLEEIYEEIDQMEKTEINEIKYYNYTELFGKYLSIALIFLFFELILSKTLFKEML